MSKHACIAMPGFSTPWVPLQRARCKAIFIGMHMKIIRVAVVMAATLGLGGCQSPPPEPLFRPLEANAAFGYTERQIDDTHWEVTYMGPQYRSSYSNNS